MKILLLGEYSNVHATLAEGLRHLGHQVLLASNGDYWKDYPRDIDLSRPDHKLGGLCVSYKILKNLHRFRGFDIVQIINPLFLDLKAGKHFYIIDYLLRNNGKLVMGAFGMDYFWVYENITRKPLRYSDFNIDKKLRTNKEAVMEIADWICSDKQRLNIYCANKADAIITGLYEYDVCYRPNFPEKTHFIPMPIKTDMERKANPVSNTVKIFIGISKNRSIYKGTDIMLRAAKELKTKYPEKISLKIAEGIPFNKYKQMISDSDILLDQLYSYTPAMNALEAMSQGIVCVGGGEPENYEILGETELRPILNVTPSYDSVKATLEDFILYPERIYELKLQSIEYIKRHHEYITVAQKYEQLYKSLTGNS